MRRLLGILIPIAIASAQEAPKAPTAPAAPGATTAPAAPGAPGTPAAAPATEWKEYAVAGLRFQLPPEWAQHAVEKPSDAEGTVFTAEHPKEAWLRIRVLPGMGTVPKVRKSTQDDLHEPTWEDLVQSIHAQGYEFEGGSPARSHFVEGVLEDSMVIPTIQNGVKKGYRILQWSTATKVIRAELTYVRKMSRSDFDLVGDLWQTFKYDRTSGAVVAAQSSNSGTAVPTSVKPTAVPTATLIAPTPAIASAAPAKPRTAAEILQNYRDSLVFIEGPGSAGSGFIYKTKDGTFLMTNQHVAAGMPTMKCTRLDGTPVKLGAGSTAVGHDEVRFATESSALPFEMGEQIENFAKIGDDIVVLGNGEGSRVIVPLHGKLVGLGPDRIEVDAAFVPGNSGSPIIHLGTGKVIGIATYLERRRFAELADKKDPKIRRFGYRLDSVKQWQPLNWPLFQAESAELGKIQNLTHDFGRMLDDLSEGRALDPGNFAGSALGGILGDLVKARSRQAMSAPDRQRAIESFLRTLRSTTQSDITGARSRLRYDFFVRQLNEEAGARDEFFKIFDKLTKNVAR